MSRIMFVALACLVLRFGVFPETAQAQAVVPMISLQSSETRSGHIASFEPHLFLTPVYSTGGRRYYRGNPESSPAVAVRYSNITAVQVQVFLTGVTSRPEEYPGLGKVYGVLHERPVGQRGIGKTAGFSRLSDDQSDDRDLKFLRVMAMEAVPYKRLRGKRVQYLEATPAELNAEIDPPDVPGTYFYVIQVAGEWRIDTTTGMPLLPIALRNASKSTKYSPIAFRIDWLEDEDYDRLAGIASTSTMPKSVRDNGNSRATNGDEGNRSDRRNDDRSDNDQKSEKPERAERPRDRTPEPPPAPEVKEWDTTVSLHVTRWIGDEKTGYATDELRKDYEGRFAFLITHDKPSEDMQPPVSPSEENAPKGIILGRILEGHTSIKSHLKASGPVYIVAWITCHKGWSKRRWALINPDQSSARLRFPLMDN